MIYDLICFLTMLILLNSIKNAKCYKGTQPYANQQTLIQFTISNLSNLKIDKYWQNEVNSSEVRKQPSFLRLSIH